jgi:hypothetical protein
MKSALPALVLLGSLTTMTPGSPPDPQPSGSYLPPAASRQILGNIVQQLQQATPVDGKRFSNHGATFIGILPSGALYFEVPTMDIDDDGGTAGSPPDWASPPVRRGKVDTSRSTQTSYGGILKAPPGQTDFISAFQQPYIVLPGGDPIWSKAHPIGIGDGAVVIRGNQRIDAVFADVGPKTKIGEMSLHAHQLFGVDTFTQGLQPQKGPGGAFLLDPATGQLITKPAVVTRNVATIGPFIVIVFPHTSVGKHFVSVDASLKATIDDHFNALASGTPTL